MIEIPNTGLRDDEVEFRPYMYVDGLRNKWKKRIGIYATLVLVLCMIFFFVSLYGSLENVPELTLERIIENLRAKHSKDPVLFVTQVIFIIAAVILTPIMSSVNKKKRLVIGINGIQYDSGMPDMFAKFDESWKACWGEISAIRFFRRSVFGDSPANIALEIDLGVSKKKILFLAWADVNDSNYKIFSPLRIPLNKTKFGETVIKEHRIVQALKRFGKAPIDLEKVISKSFGYGLHKNNVALSIVIMFILTVIYGVVDTVVNTERYVDGGFWFQYIAVGIIEALIAYAVLRKTKVPLAEAIFVSILSGGATCVALYPGYLRINQFTDPDGLQSYKYVKVDDLTFDPLNNSDLPKMIFSANKPYWENIEKGTVYEFEIRYGGLRFYQYDNKNINNEIRAFFQNR